MYYSLKSTPNDRYFEKFFMAILNLSSEFSPENKSPNKYFLYFVRMSGLALRQHCTYRALKSQLCALFHLEIECRSFASELFILSYKALLTIVSIQIAYEYIWDSKNKN